MWLASMTQKRWQNEEVNAEMDEVCPECCSERELWQWFGEVVSQGRDSSAIWGSITVSITMNSKKFSVTFDSMSILIAGC